MLELELSGLRAMVGDELAAEYLEQFREELIERLRHLQECYPASLSKTAEIAHQLVGLSGTLGFAQLASISGQLCHAVRKAAPQDELDLRFDAALTEIRAVIERLSSIPVSSSEAL